MHPGSALAGYAVCALLSLAACDSKPKASAAKPAANLGATAASAVLPSKEPHADHDCATAHPAEPRPPAPTATALSADARARVTSLRISAPRGSVIVRRGEDGWTIGGARGCTVDGARIERALDNLSATTAVSTSERPASGDDFELQLVAQIGQERALHFDIAGRSDGTDLIQLADHTTHRLSGLDRDLWSPDASVWCAPNN